MRVTLFGVPKRAWALITGWTDASAGLILWRLFVLAAITGALLVAAASGSIGTVGAIILGFVLTTLLSKLLADDVLAIWRNVWNAEWAEVEV